MSQKSQVALPRTPVDRLAQFFPGAVPVRIPVRVTGAGGAEEATNLNFATANEVLFASVLPLEYGDQVRVLNADGSVDTDAVVVALRYHEGCKAVAARFLQRVANWIIQA